MPTYEDFENGNRLSKRTAEELAWMAGLFEGEGSAGLTTNQNGLRYIRISITQKGQYTANLIKEMTGFGFHHALENDCWQWGAACRGARAFLAAIRPHMRLPHKIAQVERALKEESLGHVRAYRIRHYKYRIPCGRWKYRPLPYDLRII